MTATLWGGAFGLAVVALAYVLYFLVMAAWATVRNRRVVKRWREDFTAGRASPSMVLPDVGMRVYTLKNGEQRMVPIYDEAVLLGPVSAWVAEGEARAVREWEAKQPKPAPSRIEVYGPSPRPVPKAEFSRPEPDCDRCEWVEVTRLGDSRHHYLRGVACGVCPATRDPRLPWPMFEAERR